MIEIAGSEGVLYGLLDHIRLDGVLALHALIAGVVTLVIGAVVIIVQVARLGFAELPCHGCAAMSTENLAAEGIIHGGIHRGLRALILLDTLLHGVENILRNHGIAHAFDDLTSVYITPYISRVGECTREGVVIQLAAIASGGSSLHKLINDLLHGDAGCVLLKQVTDDTCLVLVNDKPVILHLVSIRHGTACVVLLRNRLTETALDLLSQIERVILCPGFQHGFHEDGFITLPDVFHGRHHADTVLLQALLIDG